MSGDAETLAARIRREALIADRPGQLDRLEQIADDLAAHDAAIRAEAKIQGVEEAAANMPLARTAQPYEGAAKWLRARAAALRAAQPTEDQS